MLLEVDDLQVTFKTQGGLARARRDILAVNGASFTIARGESLGVVGESGCGKSTLARAICGLVRRSAGSIRLEGAELPNRRDTTSARRIQMIFQDPTASLNPRMRVGSVLRELLTVHKIHEGSAADRRAAELMTLVELPVESLQRRPHEFSGGQRQRIGIARALAVEPDLLIADEAVSALDVSTQAVIVSLLNSLRRDLGLSLIFISHDLGIVRAVSDRVAVMYLGRVVEEAATDELYNAPRHPYARSLLDAVPRIDTPRRPGSSRLAGEPPSPLNPPSGCSFHERCPIAQPQCSTDVPQAAPGLTHTVRCHLA